MQVALGVSHHIQPSYGVFPGILGQVLVRLVWLHLLSCNSNALFMLSYVAYTHRHGWYPPNQEPHQRFWGWKKVGGGGGGGGLVLEAEVQLRRNDPLSFVTLHLCIKNQLPCIYSITKTTHTGKGLGCLSHLQVQQEIHATPMHWIHAYSLDAHTLYLLSPSARVTWSSG